MNKEIILRVRGPEGQYRLNLWSRDTYGELLLQLSKKLNYPIRDILVSREDNKPISLNEGIKIGDVPYFKDGAILIVNCANPKPAKKQQGPIKPVEKEALKPANKDIKPQQYKQKCNHGPSGRCLNCAGTVDLKDKKALQKMLCQHGPNAKCIHCLDNQFISDVAHISFDNWLEERKLKCKGVHPLEVKCNNCLPPSKIQYEVDKTCKNHEAYPKAMCNKCIPPNVIVRRQEYRHVDYVQFMNTSQIQQFIRYWLPRKNQEQRVAFLYGYYAEDPHYKGGIRVIVQAIYQPKQKGTFSGFQILQHEETPVLNSVTTGLTLQRVGWLYTEVNHDVVMSETHTRMAARFQEAYRVPHTSGYDISNFITVILRPDEKNENQVKPEVFMVSDQGQALQKYKLFDESDSRRKMKVKIKKETNDAYPSFIVGGKNATQFQPEFLLVKISYGTSTNKFAILKKAQFPPVVRGKPSKKDLKEYMKKNKNIKKSSLKYGDFNLLLYLAQEIDPDTAHSIAECVANETQASEHIDDIIEHKADL